MTKGFFFSFSDRVFGGVGADYRKDIIRRQSGVDPAFKLDTLVIETGHFVVDQSFPDEIIKPEFLLIFYFFNENSKDRKWIQRV